MPPDIPERTRKKVSSGMRFIAAGGVVHGGGCLLRQLLRLLTDQVQQRLQGGSATALRMRVPCADTRRWQAFHTPQWLLTVGCRPGLGEIWRSRSTSAIERSTPASRSLGRHTAGW